MFALEGGAAELRPRGPLDSDDARSLLWLLFTKSASERPPKSVRRNPQRHGRVTTTDAGSLCVMGETRPSLALCQPSPGPQCLTHAHTHTTRAHPPPMAGMTSHPSSADAPCKARTEEAAKHKIAGDPASGMSLHGQVQELLPVCETPGLGRTPNPSLQASQPEQARRRRALRFRTIATLINSISAHSLTSQTDMRAGGT